MIKFNTILLDEGLEPKDVKLVRHRDTRKNYKNTPYLLWAANDGRLELYQSYQARRVFDGVRYIASFVATPLNETLFVGVYSVNEVSIAEKGEIDPLNGDDMGGIFRYDLTGSSHLIDYQGRLIVNWGKGYRSWVQRAVRQNKEIMEIRGTVNDIPFPGFLDFRGYLSNLLAVPASWRLILGSVKGVYLLVETRTGKQYVGSAYGEGGFWSRWEEYVRTGHGGNKEMKKFSAEDYQVSILEVAPSSASDEDIIEIEARWKRKTLSKVFGLNAN